MLNGRTPSVKDVAAAAGVSLGTVSNVMNRPEVVSSGTRERVERAMAELGFVRNESARQLRAGTSRTLAYVMLDGSNPFFHDVAQGIEMAAEDADLSLFICNSNSRAEREEIHLDRLLQQRVQGYPDHPGQPRGAAPRRALPPRRATGDRRPGARRRRLLLGRGRRRARRPDRGRAPGRAGPHPGRVHRRPVLDRPGPRAAAGRPGDLGRAGPAARGPDPPAHRGADRGRGPIGRRAAGRAAGAAPADRRLLRQRPARAGSAAAGASAPACASRNTWPSSATTTSSSPPRPRYR